MKKLLTFLLIGLLSISVVACGQTENSLDNSNSSQSTTEPASSVEETSSTTTSQLTPVSATFFADGVRKTLIQGETADYSGIAARVLYNDGNEYIFGTKDLTIDNGGLNTAVPGVYHHTVTFYTLPEKLEFDITVMKKPLETSGVVNLIVDSAYTGVAGEFDAENNSCFKTISDAVLALNYGKFSAESIKNIYLKEGTYNEKINIPSTVKNVRLYGGNEDASKTVITYGDCAQTFGTDGSATFTVKGSGFMAKDITFENSYDYINGTESNKQALAFLSESDCSILDNCVFLGYQDTLQAKNGRQYYKDCVIKGTTDFIFGKAAVAVFDNCDIVTRFTKEGITNNGYITAHSGMLTAPSADGSKGMLYGYVFMGCTLSAENGVLDGTVSLGRPWRCDATVAYINCEMGAHIATSAYGTEGVTKTRYTSMSGGNRTNLPSEANFAEFGNTGAGAVNTQSDDFTLLQNADNYTLSNIFAKTNGQLSFATDWNAQADIDAFCA